MLTVTAAAIKRHTGIYSFPPPARHHHVVHWLSDQGQPQHEHDGEVQGFLLSDGSFVDRIEGAKIAIESGQILKLNWPPNLYSEDLW
jgi:hypothetical protein